MMLNNTSIIFPKIKRNRNCNASAFLFSKLCPLCAPARRAFMLVWALENNFFMHDELKIFSNSPANIQLISTAMNSPTRRENCNSVLSWHSNFGFLGKFQILLGLSDCVMWCEENIIKLTAWANVNLSEFLDDNCRKYRLFVLTVRFIVLVIWIIY